MKKYILLLGVLFGLTFYSCSDNDEVGIESNLSEIVKLTEPVYGKDFTLSNYENSPAKSGVGVGFAFEIGRKSRGCERVGVCRLIAVWIVIVRHEITHENEIVVELQEIEGNKFVQIQLDNYLDEDFDTNFYIDEDMIDEETQEVIFNAGVYSLDESIGEYGGYTIPVN